MDYIITDIHKDQIIKIKHPPVGKFGRYPFNGQRLFQRLLLVKLHTEWMKQNNCEKIVVTVSYGHNSVLDFYHKVGFYERLIELEYKE